MSEICDRCSSIRVRGRRCARPRLIVTMIDDDEARYDAVQRWSPPDVFLTHVDSAGTAFGVLRTHDIKEAVQGILLDFDLTAPSTLRYGEAPLTGLDVARKMVQTLEHDLPVLVHSMSRDRDLAITMLRTAGFPVTQIPYAELTQETYHRWLDEVRDRFVDYKLN